MSHESVWWGFVGQVGAPLFSATLVASLLSDELALQHSVLMAAGLGMMGLCHWRTHHRGRGSITK